MRGSDSDDIWYGKENIGSIFEAQRTDSPEKGSKRNDKQKDSELAKYQNKSYARNNLLNSYTMNIMVSFNTDLRIGDMIEIKLPYKSDARNTKSGKTDFSDVSGKYLISKLMHMINADRSSSTHLEIIRDTFSAK